MGLGEFSILKLVTGKNLHKCDGFMGSYGGVGDRIIHSLFQIFLVGNFLTDSINHHHFSPPSWEIRLGFSNH